MTRKNLSKQKNSWKKLQGSRVHGSQSSFNLTEEDFEDLEQLSRIRAKEPRKSDREKSRKRFDLLEEQENTAFQAIGKQSDSKFIKGKRKLREVYVPEKQEAMGYKTKQRNLTFQSPSTLSTEQNDNADGFSSTQASSLKNANFDERPQERKSLQESKLRHPTPNPLDDQAPRRIIAPIAVWKISDESSEYTRTKQHAMEAKMPEHHNRKNLWEWLAEQALLQETTKRESDKSQGEKVSKQESDKPKKQNLLGFNIETEAQEQVIALAKESNMTISQYLRKLIEDAIQKNLYYSVICVKPKE